MNTSTEYVHHLWSVIRKLAWRDRLSGQEAWHNYFAAQRALFNARGERDAARMDLAVKERTIDGLRVENKAGRKMIKRLERDVEFRKARSVCVGVILFAYGIAMWRTQGFWDGMLLICLGIFEMSMMREVKE